MQNVLLQMFDLNSKRVARTIEKRPIVRHCLIALLAFVLMWLSACSSGRVPLVRTETVEVRVPVKPNIPDEILAACLPTRTLPQDPTVGDLDLWTEELTLALESCNKHKAALRRAIAGSADEAH